MNTTTTINKETLKNYRFSDNPIAWILEAESFNHSAGLLLQTLQAPRNSRFISLQESTRDHMCLKVVCYLYSVAIELFLKGLYSNNKSPEDQEKTESFRHNIQKLTQKLVAKQILNKNELNEESIKIAHVILEWSGRYYKPNQDKVDDVIKSFFEEIPEQPNMLKPKFSINLQTTTELKQLANQLSDKAQIPESTIAHLLFLPF